MKPKKSSGSFKPFEGLATLIRNRSISLSPGVALRPERSVSKKSSGLYRQHRKDKRNKAIEFTKNTTTQFNAEEEKRLFLEAMTDVKPLLHNLWRKRSKEVHIPDINEDDTNEAMIQLKHLVENGDGFIVADTPEYFEGTGYNINPLVAKRLHRGDYSIQAHIDLHGLGVTAAKDVFERFLKDSLLSGKRAVLVIHGRGLSSPEEPVLKYKVYDWLTRGQWKKWVIAFSSARLCDGGTGATYVLLRQRPLSKRFRKQKT